MSTACNVETRSSPWGRERRSTVTMMGVPRGRKMRSTVTMMEVNHKRNLRDTLPSTSSSSSHEQERKHQTRHQGEKIILRGRDKESGRVQFLLLYSLFSCPTNFFLRRILCLRLHSSAASLKCRGKILREQKSELIVYLPDKGAVAKKAEGLW